MTDPRFTPVIVGVGQVNDRPEDPASGLDSLGLMEAALRRADADAGGGWLARIDSLAVVRQIAFPGLGDLPEPLARNIGAKPTRLEQTPLPSGDGPILLMHEAANRIGRGETSVACVVGGEALRTAARRAAADSAVPNAMRAFGGARAAGLRQRYGLVAPIDIYPLYENATRAAWGQSLAEGQEESGKIWSRFAGIAAENPDAWLRKPVTPAEIVTPGPNNGLLAFPYTKLMVANASVNQGAAFLMTSLARARAHGVPEHRIVHIGHGAAAHESDDIFARARYDVSPGMTVALERTLALNGLSAADLDLVELYSCFPCIPKMARRIVGWPIDRAATVSGGLTFAGGPIGNYMSHAVAAMVDRLRRGARNGLLYANGGLATHNHAILLSRTPTGAVFPQAFDCQAEADALREPVPVLRHDYAGPGRIETFTVLYDRSGAPRQGVIIARTPDGARFPALVPATDSAGITRLTAGLADPVGAAGVARPGPDDITLWRFA